MRFVYGILGIALGIFILRYSPQLLNFFGRDADAERIFGSGMGGTHTVIKLAGLACVLLSLLYMFGVF